MSWVRKERLRVMLIALTLSLPLLQHFAFNRVFTIDEHTSQLVVRGDDRDQGGDSVASLQHTPSGTVLNCQIVDTYEWPYCIASYVLPKEVAPIDLTQFDFVRLYIRSKGPGKQYVKVYLRNSAEYSGLVNEISYKVHEIQYAPNEYPYPLDVPLNNFIVAHWWLSEMGTSPLLSRPELDSIVHVDVATGADREPGEHIIEINHIEFHGKWLSYAQVASILLAIWMSYALYKLYLSITKAKNDTDRARQSKETLETINASLALEKDELKAQASRDYLTGVYNRAGLQQFFIQFNNHFQRDNHVYSIIFIDIDHFKRINDEYGHDTGDNILKSFAKIVLEHIRHEDIFGRWGGEEFILLLPNTEQQQASILAEKLRQVIFDAQWPFHLRITCSFGVTQSLSGQGASELIQRADAALYQAKTAGRNRVITAS